MIDLNGFKILKYNYPFNSEKLGEMIWDKMTEQEKKWAVKLTLDGISETGDDGEKSWDMFFLDDRLNNKIKELLEKYKVPYDIENITFSLIENTDSFTDEFTQKLNKFLNENLTIDDVLDRIIDVGMENLTIFEKYYLNINNED
jgi:hypothetical protein